MDRRLCQVPRAPGRGRLRAEHRDERDPDPAAGAQETAGERPEPDRADRELHAPRRPRLDRQAVRRARRVPEAEHLQGDRQWRFGTRPTPPARARGASRRGGRPATPNATGWSSSSPPPRFFPPAGAPPPPLPPPPP